MVKRTGRRTDRMPERVAEVKGCPHGRGAFALRDFEKGERIALLTEQVFTTSTTSPGCALRIGERLYWDEGPRDEATDWTWHLDHDPNPNVHLAFLPEEKTAIATAARRINEGDELFIDYTEYYDGNYPSNPWSIENLSNRG